MKYLHFLLGGLLCALLVGCPSAEMTTDPVLEDPDPTLAVEDGVFGGTATQEVTLGQDVSNKPITSTRSRYILATITEGKVALVRLGSGRFGQFLRWQNRKDEVAEEEFVFGDGNIRSLRRLREAGQSSLDFAVEVTRTNDEGESAGTGEGTIELILVDGQLQFSLNETVTYTSGPLSGEQQTGRIEGTLSRIENLPDPTPIDGDTNDTDSDDGSDDDTGNTDGSDNNNTDDSEGGSADNLPIGPATDENPDGFTNTGTEVLPDGSTQTYSGNREIATVEETATSPEGEELNIIVDNLNRTFVAEDGSTSTETDVSKVYFRYDEEGRGRIIGYHENGEDRFIVDPPDGIRGSVDALEVGQTRNYTATFDDGTVDVFNEEITQVSEVVLPDGVYEVYVSVSRLERTRPDGTVETIDVVASIHPTKGMVYRQVSGSILRPDGLLKTTEFEEYLGAE